MIAVSPVHAVRGQLWWLSQSRTLWWVALLGFLAVAPYLNALKDGFTFDDEPQILTNAAVNGGVDAMAILASPLYPGNIYRPFSTFTFALNQALTPGNAAAFHAINVVLHGGVTLMVFWLAIGLFQSLSAAGIAAALFALHPLHTEAVTSVVGRAEELTALFGLLALAAANRIDATGDVWKRRGWHALSVILFIACIMSKESGLTFLPLVILGRPALRGERLWQGLWNEIRSLDWVPYALCAVLFLKLRQYATGGLSTMSTVTPLESMLAFVPAGLRIRTALAVLWDYVGLLTFPLVLSADYSTAQVVLVESWWDPRCIAGLVALTTLISVVVVVRQPTVAFAAAIPLITFSITSNLLFAIGTVKAERLLYAPSIGWAMLAGLGLDWCLSRRRYHRVAVLALAAVLAAFSIRTWMRNRDWADNMSLHQSAVNSSPNSAKSHYNLAVALQNEGDQLAALYHYRRALDLYPWAEGAALGIGIAYEKIGDAQRAVTWYRHTLDLDPSSLRAHNDLCHVLYVERRYSEALAACRSGLRYEPTNINLLKGLGGSMVANGEREKGLAVLGRVLVLHPEDEELKRAIAALEAETPQA